MFFRLYTCYHHATCSPCFFRLHATSSHTGGQETWCVDDVGWVRWASVPRLIASNGNRVFHFSGQEWDILWNIWENMGKSGVGIWKTSTDLPSFQFFPKAVYIIYDSLISQSQPQLSFSQGDTQGLQQRQRHALMFGSRAHLLGTQHPTGGLLSQGPQGGDRGRLGAALPMELPLINST